MPADTTVKIFHNAMPGAPVLSGTAGALIAVLDACLVNGFGTGSVDSLVISGGVATVTRAAGHPFEVGSVALIAGATVSGGSVNGEQRVLSVTGASYTFDATGIANQAATGTITHKAAPAGWAKAFSGANLAAYRPTDPAGTRFYLRVDDTAAQNARVRGFEAMTDVNTGTGPFPTDSLIPGGQWWAKSNSGSASPRNWAVVCDGRTMYYTAEYNSSYPGSSVPLGMFGDFEPVRAGDAYRCAIAGGVSDRSGSGPGDQSDTLDWTHGYSSATTAARRAVGVGGATPMVRAGQTLLQTTSQSISSGANYVGHLAFPNYADSGVYVSRMALGDDGANLRGYMRGFRYVPMAAVHSIGHRVRVPGQSALPGRELLFMTAGYPTSPRGCYAFDATGPWA
ncbi:hypothetical protein HNQ51_001712 [Inhella inkyongensis]|uniref:Uncharacterized protein n=1 Tax=Inhella inkyongensis TaxID=392593 RepID=A0A840S4L0_9BURK|nr:hypothetical protein [Inhella inkyongensis]MBB5204398.1 hypothetical protein [Inhella inkyongensis]